MSLVPQIRRLLSGFAAVLCAISLTMCGGDSLVLPSDAAPSTVTVLKGNGQTGPAGVILPDSLVLRVTDSRDRPVASQRVAFVAHAAGAGSVSPDTVSTDAQGRVAGQWTLGAAAGGQQVDARVVGTSLVATFVASAGSSSADTLFAVGGQGQTGAAGATLTDSIVVEATDRFGNPVSGIPVAFGTTGGGQVSASLVITGSDGRAAVQRVLGTGAGTQTTTATAAGLHGSPVIFSHTVQAGSPTSVVIVSGNNQTAAAGTRLPDSLVVRVVDASNNGIANQSVAWVLGTGSGSVTPASSKTNAAGTAVTRWTLGPVAGVNTLSAVVSGVGVQAFTATGRAAGASAVKLNAGDNQTGTAGSALATPISVLVTDANNNPVSNVPIAWTVATGGGSVSAPTSTTNAAGVAQVNWTLGGTVGTQTAKAAAGGLTGSPVTFTATAGAGSAQRLSLATEPSVTAQSGVPFAQQPIVQIIDANNNPVGQSGVVVTASIATGSGAALGGTLTATTNANGTATFGNLKLTGAPGSYALAFGAQNLTSVNSTAITIGAGAPALLAMATQPSTSASSGQAFAQQPSVQITDASGNAVADAGVTISAGIASGGGTLNGTLTATTNANGLAQFTSLAIVGSSGPRTLSFGAPNLTTVISSTVTIGAGGATTIALNAGDNQSAAAGAAVPVAPSVLVTDGSGNPVAGVAVTFAVASGGGSVAGGSPTTNANGIAAVGSWTLGAQAGANSLTATATGLSGSPVTFQATATAGNANRIAIVTQPSASARSGVVFAQQPVVRLEDSNGNPVPTSGVAVAVTSSGGSLGGTTTVATVNGVATFTNLSLTGAAGGYFLSFGVPSVTAATSSTITLTAGNAVRIGVVTQPSTSATSGSVFTQQPAVQLFDAGGNAVGQGGVTITAAIASGGGSLGGTTAVGTNGSGVAQFTDLSLSGAPGARTLLFAAPGLTSDTSNAIAVGNPPPATIAVNAGDGQSTAAGSAVGTSPSVLVTDAAGHPVSGVLVTFAVAGGGGSITGGTPSTNASGIATVGSWTLGSSVGANTLTATASGSGISGNPVTFSATAVPGAAAALQFSVQPTTTVVNQPIAPAVQVAIVDAFGNLVSSATNAVTVSLGSAGAATLSGTLTVNATSGFAIFPDLSVDQAATGYTLSAVASGLTGNTSGTFDITP